MLKRALITVLAACGIYLLKQYSNGGICASTERIDGKIVIVTGANTGIGKETAEDLVMRGAKVYMACRSLERGMQAADDIKVRNKVVDSNLIVMHLDLNSLSSVRSFVEEFKKKENSLDILINNAGVMWVPQGKTEDGFETTFGVNHLGPFLLTNLLMDFMVDNSKPSRIINVSSRAHYRGTMQFDDLMSTKSYNSRAAYAQSKLANVLFARELAKRLQGTKVTAYSLHPGAVRTELMRHIPLIYDYAVVYQLLYLVTWPVLKEPWNGAQTTICCAVDSSLELQSGKYYSDCTEVEPLPEALDDLVAKKLWDVSVSLVGLQPSEIHEKLV